MTRIHDPMIEHISFNPALQNSEDLALLQATVGRFQRIFNGSGYGFWEWDLHNQHIEWSGGFWMRLGYGPEDAKDICDAKTARVDISTKGFKRSSEILGILNNFESLIRRMEQIYPRAFAASGLKR